MLICQEELNNFIFILFLFFYLFWIVELFYIYVNYFYFISLLRLLFCVTDIHLKSGIRMLPLTARTQCNYSRKV